VTGFQWVMSVCCS